MINDATYTFAAYESVVQFTQRLRRSKFNFQSQTQKGAISHVHENVDPFIPSSYEYIAESRGLRKKQTTGTVFIML